MNTEIYNAMVAELRGLIRLELNSCNGNNSPYVCSLKEGEGYQSVEDRLINMCINQGISAAHAIAQLEAEYNPNRLD